MRTKCSIAALMICIALSGKFTADASVFDEKGIGREIIPSVGYSAALSGATIADENPSSSSITSPFSIVNARGVSITGGYMNISTSSKYRMQEQRGVETIFPSLSIVIPWKGVWILTGLYQERLGKIKKTDTDTSYSVYVFRVEEKRETSIHSVPILASLKLGTRVTVSSGVILSFLDIRQETRCDFTDETITDTKDIYDASADGSCFASGILIDLDQIRLASFYRLPVDLKGQMEWENRYSGIYKTTDFSVSAKHGLSAGIMLKPVTWLSTEFDYYRSPWSNLKAQGSHLNNRLVERWCMGVTYSGDHIWHGSRFPLHLGFYTQPIDWVDQEIGRIRESAFSLGTSFSIGQERALLSFSLLSGRRRTQKETEVKEDFFAFGIGISAMERWEKAVTR
ncbi:MAG: hypothetical protein ACUVUU_03520 [bacterium]